MDASCMAGFHKRGEATYDRDGKMTIIMNIRRHEQDGDDDAYISECESSTSSSSFGESNISEESSSSDMLDDDVSSSTSSSNNGPLYQLSELMDQLPIKRGLSKFYQGKSQSFTSMARVKSIEDLAKKETPYQKKLKACRSYGGGLNNFRLYTQPKPTISKKTSKGSLSNLSCLGRKGSFIMPTSRSPLSPVKIT